MDLDTYLIEQLNNKFINKPVMIEGLIVTNLYHHSPQDFFSDESSASNGRECYILTTRNLRYGLVTQPNRRARDGSWEPIGTTSGRIFGRDGVVGFKQQLCYFRGEPHNLQRTSWTMFEYRLRAHCCSIECDHKPGRLDEWVLCKVYDDFDPDILSSQMDNMDIG